MILSNHRGRIDIGADPSRGPSVLIPSSGSRKEKIAFSRRGIRGEASYAFPPTLLRNARANALKTTFTKTNGLVLSRGKDNRKTRNPPANPPLKPFINYHRGMNIGAITLAVILVLVILALVWYTQTRSPEMSSGSRSLGESTSPDRSGSDEKPPTTPPRK